MRKFLAILLALVIAIGIFASCEKPTAQLPDIPMNESTDEQKNQNPTPESNGAPIESESEGDTENGNENNKEPSCDHEGGADATCKTESVCEICNNPYGGVDTGNHEGEEAWLSTENGHTMVYSCCEQVIEEEEPHIFVNGACSVCQYECLHSETDGHHCVVCKGFVSHEYQDGKCLICGLLRDENKITFGTYPQSKVSDNAILTVLSGETLAWTSSNGMWYADVEKDNEKYRGVKTSENGSAQWFKYEPITWTVLEEADGKALILCDLIIDAKAYDESSNNYKDSTIRAWLNEEFINSAFSELQRAVILTVKVENKISTGYETPRFYCDDTFDKIFLLSRAEVKTYGFNSNGEVEDPARQKQATDYVVSQINGGYDATSGAWWWLRTPAPHTTDVQRSDLAHRIKVNGVLHNSSVNSATGGVLPAIWVNI